MATSKQKKYVQARAKGLDRDTSAIMAGYSENGGDPQVSRIEKHPDVQQELARIRAETAKNTNITKEDVVQMLMDAAGMAKMLDDPTGLVSAAREIGKMLGFYAPETKKVMHGLDKEQIMAVMEDMSDDELIRLKNGKVINGTAKRLPEAPSLGAPSNDAEGASEDVPEVQRD